MKIQHLLFTSLFSFASLSFAADTGLDPSSVQVRVYAVAISPNTDCSNATAVTTYPGGQVFDFESNPTIFSGAVANGSYPCVILQISDQVTFTPATTSTSGHCVAGTPVTTPICNSGNGQRYQTMTVNNDNTVTFGAVQGCTAAVGSGGESVALFLSTASSPVTSLNNVTFGAVNSCKTAIGSGGESLPRVLSPASTLGHVMAPFIQPSSSTASECIGCVSSGCGINLASALVVGTTTSGTFVVDFHGQVADQGGECGLEAPTFSFR